MNILNKLILGEIKLSQALYYVSTNCRGFLSADVLKWIDNECNGYEDMHDLPDYRSIECTVLARFTDGIGNFHEQKLDVTKINDYLEKNGLGNLLVSKMNIVQNVESLETSIDGNKGGSLMIEFPKNISDMIAQWFEIPPGCRNIIILQQCHLEQGKNLLSVIKSKLIMALKNTRLIDDDVVDNKQCKRSLVFISHASKDKVVIKLFIDNVLRRGLNLNDENIVFTSYESTGVVPGDNIPAYIESNINNADVVLFMISPNYKNSEVCMNEVGAAWALKKSSIQVMLPNTNIDNLGWLLHLEKAAIIDDEDSLDSLMEEMCNRLEISPITAKHWNPCKRDFLEALKELPSCYDEDKPEYMLLDINDRDIIECHPHFVKVNYYDEFKKNGIQDEYLHSDIPTNNGIVNLDFIRSIQSRLLEVSTITPVKVINKTINYSYVKIQLHFVNNSNNP